MAGQILYLIKRYRRARIFHPLGGGYVSSEGFACDVDELREWQRQGVAFRVLDGETGEDVTQVLLA